MFFDHDSGTTHSSGKTLFTARLIPYRGSWLEFEFDANDVLHVRVDRRRKFLSTILLRALGYNSNEAILALFYGRDTFTLAKRDLLLDLSSPGVTGVPRRPGGGRREGDRACRRASASRGAG